MACTAALRGARRAGNDIYLLARAQRESDDAFYSRGGWRRALGRHRP